MKLQSVTYEELKKHSTYSDAWISVGGTVYDITHFIDHHPFGDTFRGNLGTDCSGIFASAHVNTNVDTLLDDHTFLHNNNIIVVGYLDVSNDLQNKNNDAPLLDRIVYKKINEDAFWLELKKDVIDYLRDNNESVHYSFREGLMILSYHFGLYLLLSYLTWIEGSLIACVLLGIHVICALANIPHMATHYGFTSSRPLNFIAFYFFDLTGLSGLEWQITHQTHHNQPHSAIDHQTNVYDLIGVRRHKYMKLKNFHKYQHIYYWIVGSIYHLFKTLEIVFWLSRNKEFIRHKHEIVTHTLVKILFLAQIIACIYLQGFWAAVVLVTLFSLTYSQAAFLLLFNDHGDTHDALGRYKNVNELHEKLSWAEIQVITSNNWYPTNWLLSFLEFHHGYFNYHIEHHLFPTFKPKLLKKISPIVKNVCTKHNIPYISTTFTEVQFSLQEHITKLGAKTEGKQK